MQWQSLFNPAATSARFSLGLLLLRLVVGPAFMLHGWGKIQNPFGWMGEGAGTPGIFQAAAAVSEFGGGIAWTLGLLMPLASLGLLCTMGVAVYTHAVVFGDPFVKMDASPGGMYEPALVYFVISILFLLVGPGRFSLDRLIFGRAGSRSSSA